MELRSSEIRCPLKSWDIYATYLYEINRLGRIKQDLQILENYQKQFDWAVNLESLLTSPYDALVLTDKDVKIKWVSSGFAQMTGYPKREVLDQSPKMFQGRRTSEDSRSRFRQKLNSNGSFVEEVINYRKNGEEYYCRVEIHPLFSGGDDVSHYIALENEVKYAV